MTPLAKELLTLLRKDWVGCFPFVVRSFDHLLSGHFQSQSWDLVFVGGLSFKELATLNSVNAGRLIYEGQAPMDPVEIDHLVDAAWDEALDPVASAVQVLSEHLQVSRGLTHSATALFGTQAGSLFLDRDDVIVKNIPYNHNPDLVELIPGVVELIRQAHKNGKLVIICSNQSGIGRSKISLHQYQQVHQEMLRQLALEGVWVDDTYWASFIQNSPLEDKFLEPQMRKPRPGMFLQAAKKWSIDMSNSEMIGDSASDLVAAFTAGVKKLYLFRSEKSAQEIQKLEKFQKRNARFEYRFIENFTDFWQVFN